MVLNSNIVSRIWEVEGTVLGVNLGVPL